MSSLEAVGTSSLHSSLKVPPMPLPAQQFLQPPPRPTELLAIIHCSTSRGVVGTSAPGTNILPFQQPPELELTQTLVLSGEHTEYSLGWVMLQPRLISHCSKCILGSTSGGLGNLLTKQRFHFSIEEKGDCRGNHFLESRSQGFSLHQICPIPGGGRGQAG